VQLRRVTASLVTLAAIAGGIAGCGGSGAEPNTAQSSQPAAQHVASGQGLTISDFKFIPGSLAVERGARITVTNRDSTVTLSKAGTYKFHCTIHPFMHGTLVVR
jgi:plastocyanin